MFGISDPWVWSGYLLCIASTVLCVLYGIVSWNKGDDAVTKEDTSWVDKEKKIEEEL
ncbi:MAG: hypothetical protein NTU94_10150 [Planctomycetota bacterium]|nr:hypothetical protein [Planctomycetota bacterium]